MNPQNKISRLISGYKVRRFARKLQNASASHGNSDTLLLLFPESTELFKLAYCCVAPVLTAQEKPFIVILTKQNFDLLNDDIKTACLVYENDEDPATIFNSLAQKVKADCSMYIDLNPGLTSMGYFLAHYTRTGKKIGFQSRHSDGLYNIQIERKDSDFFEAGFTQIGTMLPRM